MRILFAFAGGRGHLEPLVPLARAAEARRHAVAFAGRPRMAAAVEALGFRAFAAGPDAGLAPVRRAPAPLDVEREMRAVGAGFAGRVGRARAAELVALLEAWRPDVVACEELDFGAMVAAERLGLPWATVAVTATGTFVRAEHVAGPLDALRAEHGLAPDPGLAAPHRHLLLSPFPPSLRDPAPAPPRVEHGFRAIEGRRDPRAREGRAGRRLVYFSLGTVFPVESGDLFARVVAGLRELAADVAVSVGPDVDPAELGPQPASVRVERWIPQAEILPRCDLVVSHGGSGSVTGALAHGLPMLLLPLGADQPLNAARCEALGVARVLDAATATPEAVREAAAEVLRDPAARRAAARLADEIRAVPEPARAVERIERLAAAPPRARRPG